MDPVGEVSISITGGAVVGAVVGAGAGLVIAFAASGTVTRLEPVNFGVVSLIFLEVFLIKNIFRWISSGFR